jgi:membrane protease YdiL (CAAX protease family)
MLPPTRAGLLVIAAQELFLFGLLFSAAWFLSRVTAQELLLSWRGRVRPVLIGLLDSILLRVSVSVAMLIFMQVTIALGSDPAELAARLRPEVEQIVDTRALVDDPVYLALCLTLISFVVAGFREELWRAGLLAGLSALFPKLFTTTPKRLIAIALAALLFGAGHITQGIGGVAAATLLGFGLGLVMVGRRSTWQAVLAHGFFNAASFVGLYLLAKYRPDLLPSV